MDKQQLKSTVAKVLDEMRERPIPLGISNRHIHLCTEDYVRLFPNQPISKKKGLLQPGQYAALGIAAPLRMSGNIQGTPGVRLVSPFAELDLASGVIVAQRHIHMSPLDALILRVSHGDKVSVAINGDERRLIFDNVAVRVSPDMRLEMHIDTDEANAAGADNPQAFATLVTSQ